MNPELRGGENQAEEFWLWILFGHIPVLEFSIEVVTDVDYGTLIF